MKANSIERAVRIAADCLSVTLDDGRSFHLGLVDGRIYATVREADEKPETPRHEATFSAVTICDLMEELITAEKAGEV